MTISVHLDLPDAAAPRVRYALGTLLHGLGLVPRWGRAGRLYVGVEPESSSAPLRLRLRPDLLHAGPVGSPAGWLHHGGRRWPLPVGPAGEHAAAPLGIAIVEAAVVESTFWWLTGAQETVRDAYGRAAWAGSLHRVLDVPDQPAVDGYRLWLADALRAAKQPLAPRTWGGAPFAVALTHDVDALGRWRPALGALRRARPLVALRRLLAPDPRRASVVALANLARRHGAHSTFFWKGGATAPEDVPHRLDASLVRGLVADGFEAGLHPSYGAVPDRLAAEAAAVARAAGAAPVAVRSHFLRWTEPATLRAYAPVGLDSTLGWAEAPGFRRGTAAPFRLYDTSAERETDLWELPLSVMDTTLFTHLNLSEDAARDVLDRVIDAAQAVGGCAVVLWHPAMDAEPVWARHLAVLDAALARARASGAAVGPLRGLFEAWNGAPPGGYARAPDGL